MASSLQLRGERNEQSTTGEQQPRGRFQSGDWVGVAGTCCGNPAQACAIEPIGGCSQTQADRSGVIDSYVPFLTENENASHFILGEHFDARDLKSEVAFKVEDSEAF